MSKPLENPVHLPPYAVEAVVKSLTVSEIIDSQLISIPPLWDQTQGEGITVAVLDTEGMTNHPDLEGQILCDLCRDFTGTGMEDQGSFHGAFCGGLISSRMDGFGIIGIAPKSKLVFVRCLDDRGGGSPKQIERALRYCLTIPVDVISMSLGMYEVDNGIEDALAELYSQGKVVVAAAGNDGRDRMCNYPASSKFTIAVGASDKNGKIASFSSRGPQIDIFAPGCHIYSLYGKRSYGVMSGSSMSTPIVASVIALAIAKHRLQEASTGLNDMKTVEDVRQHLIKHATPIGDPQAYRAGILIPGDIVG